MKMNQASLQQLMTLSAAGLALYFGFVGKAPFVDAARILGVLVVFSWIVALCAAIIAHRLHGKLFVSLCNISAVAERTLALESLPSEVAEAAATTIDTGRLVEEAKLKLAAARKTFEIESQAFQVVFFPAQERVALLTTLALCAFVLGFVILGAGYVVWTFRA